MNNDKNSSEKEMQEFISHFYKPEGLQLRIDGQLSAFKTAVESLVPQQFELAFNNFLQLAWQNIQDQKLRIHILLDSYHILNSYAAKYNNFRVFQEIVDGIDHSEYRSEMFVKHYNRISGIYAHSLLGAYCSNPDTDCRRTPKNINPLLKAKYHFLKMYEQHISGKCILTSPQLSNILLHLSNCLILLHRYFEPIYYVKVASKNKPVDLDMTYLMAITLNAIKDNTCLDYNTLLLMRIADHSEEALKNSKINVAQIAEVQDILQKAKLNIIASGSNTDNIRARVHKVEQEFSEHNDYLKFCNEGQLFLNEHSFFCSCNDSLSDSLCIETSHSHTKIKWVKKFNEMLNVFVFDYINARLCFYNSDITKVISNTNLRKVKRDNAKMYIHNSQLKNSFKICFSILDQIAYGILEVFNISLSDYVKRKSLNERSTKLYFLSMWDLEDLIPEELYAENIYLTSLYSIAKDLDNTEYSALKSFKKIRNNIEHKIVRISTEKTNEKVIPLNYNVVEMRNQMQLLLILTKAAIFTFNNLIRNQSRILDRAAK